MTRTARPKTKREAKNKTASIAICMSQMRGMSPTGVMPLSSDTGK